jgi:leucyl-tRNA synthetase
VQDNLATLQATTTFAGHAKDVDGINQVVVRKVHATIKRATDAMEKDFAFNTTIAACMELMNELKADVLAAPVFKLGITTLLRLLAPMVPHITHELWDDLGSGSDLNSTGWPPYDAGQIDADDVEMPIQVNAKLRGKISVSRTLSGPALEQAVRAHPTIIDLIGDKTVRKLIIVPQKIINIILG